jgi:multiple sugar transport system ATP-binding protein
VHDAAEDPAPDSVALDGVVASVEYTRRQNVVAAAVGAPPVTAPGTELAAGSSSGATLRFLLPPRAAVRAGEAVRLAVEAARAHVVDAVTGRALCHPEDRPDSGTG